MPNFSIQPARPGHLCLLGAIERAAAGIFPPGSIPDHIRSDSLPPHLLEEGLRRDSLWAASVPGQDGGAETIAGYALLRSVDGLAILAQIDVHPAHGRQGIGTALVRRVEDAARSRGFPALYLTTFTHVPWNAPFYARLGFAALHGDAVPLPLRRILAGEEEAGLENRVAMRLDLE